MNYEWILISMLLGIAGASVVAHPRVLNLDLQLAAIIGSLAGVFGAVFYIILTLWKFPSPLPQLFSVLFMTGSGIGLVLWRFYRDPDRVTPKREDGIVAPADGKIIYIREISSGGVPCAIKGKRQIRIEEITKTSFFTNLNGYLIGISMSILDVHIIRSPISGKIIFKENFSGSTFSPKNWRSETENPRVTIIFENPKIKIGMVEIGTPRISRMLTSVGLEDFTRMGDRIGKITWGSQVDIIIPKKETHLLVKEGDFVLAGETIMALIEAPSEGS
jgi:phosphatidylserine decarboxylase